MKKGDIITGRIEKMNFPNKGILLTEEGAVVIKNTVPGQLVEAKILKKHGEGRAEAALVKVLEKSSLECDPACGQFGLCGGCSFMNLSYEETLKLKAAEVKALLDQAVSESAHIFDRDYTYAFEGIKASPFEFEYRNKMEFTFGDEYKDGPLAVGQHRRGGFYDILTVSDCRICDEDFRAIVTATRDYFAPLYEKKKITYYRRLQHVGFLRHLLVRKALHTGEVLIDLVTTTKEEHEKEIREWARLMEALPLKGRLLGVLHTTNDSLADVVKDEGTEILFGEDSFTEELLGLKFRVTPFSFFQTNSYGAEVLYETAREYLRDLMVATDGRAEKPVVFDLYTGTGTIAQLMAPAAEKVIGIEIVTEAVEAAKENAARNGIDNCEFIAGDVLKAIDEVTDIPDVIILDPPRDGVHPKALPKILKYDVPNILYMSSKPTSLARDIQGFALSGYKMRKAITVDMFPWTSGIETVALFTKVTSAPSEQEREDRT